MGKLEDLKPQATVRGIIPEALVTVVSVQWYGSHAVELTYKDAAGRLGNVLLYRDDEPRFEVVERGKPWSFDGDGALFRLVSEAHRIRLAYLFDPLLGVHTSLLEPLPHQITAVYEVMLPRNPLRFLLADDPGAGKTIMAGLLIKELLFRETIRRCLIVCPGNLVEQWQDELYRRFQLPFVIMTGETLDTSRSGNWFMEHDLVIVRLDKCARDESVQEKLAHPECRWDLVVVDEAHKMSATFFGGEVKYTKRYRLGQLLSEKTQHLLLMTATPHNGKEEDFQLFLALLDGDRFEGRFRDGVHQVDITDLMRRMVKEELVKMDGTPLFLERIAYTVPYRLSDLEARLYREVTRYVQEEFDRVEALRDEGRAGTVGFALTILQRRLASSPEAIYRSLQRRRERLEERLREAELFRRGMSVPLPVFKTLEREAIEDLEDAPENEVATVETEVLDQATAASTVEELRKEIATLKRLESLAQEVRRAGEDRKWRELANLLSEIFRPTLKTSSPPKLIVFTEYRDTLNYLAERVSTFLGNPQAVVTIHGGMGRAERFKAQEAFLYDPEVVVLLATDAAGEGINLQRAHLMVNYDLPWNPNRIEQRFGRIHRIGQTEVCHLWNLVAVETREGDVYHTLLRKLEEARKALGGRVFNVLGKLQFEGKPLRELLVEAIRYGEQPEVRARLNRVVVDALDVSHLHALLEERALVHEVMNREKLRRIREEMERAEARRLQPHYIESFFLEAFRMLGGTVRQRESRRYEITHVPLLLRQRDRMIGRSEPLLSRYERITFEKDLVNLPDQPLAAFVAPGHPLLDVVIDFTLERHRELLRRGTVLVDEKDPGTLPRVVFYLEYTIQDAEPRVLSKRVLYFEVDAQERVRFSSYAPYLDYRPLKSDEPHAEAILAREECSWITEALEPEVLNYAITQIVPRHLEEVRRERLEWIEKARSAIKDRLTKEIAYWDHRAEELKLEEASGKRNLRMSAAEARRRADELSVRLQKRMMQLDLESQIVALPPVLIGGFVVVPRGLLHRMMGREIPEAVERDLQEISARAREIVMHIERSLGYEPFDRETERLGYDIESRDPRTGKLRFIEVKGRAHGETVVTVTRNEILTSLNKPEDYILAIVEFLDRDTHRVHYIRRPFRREPDFGVTSVNYSLAELIVRGEKPG